MGDHSGSPSPRAQPPLSPRTTISNMPLLYYGALMVGTVALVLALCNLILVRWFPCFSGRTAKVISLGSSFKYKRNHDGSGDDSECVVCLSAYKEGEELRQLPKCNHSFHAPCIDMWLYSHIDCPLCRGAVRPPTVEQPEHYREGLLVPVTLV